MKKFRRLSAILLCVAMLLSIFGCAVTPAETTAPAVDELAMFETAQEAVDSSPNLQLDFSVSEKREVGGETYSKEASGTASYSAIGTDKAAAFVKESLIYNDYKYDYEEFYTDGTAYATITDCVFSTEMTLNAFTARQLPAVLLEPALYATVTTDTEADGTVIRFSDATAPESWLKLENAELVFASGSATLDEAGALTQNTYTVQYRTGAAIHKLSVSVKIATPETLALSSNQPDTGNCTAITSLDIPQMTVQAMCDIYHARSTTVTVNDSYLTQAAGTLLSRQTAINTYGTRDTFAASIDLSGSVTDANGTTAFAQEEAFRNGVYSFSENGGEAVTDKTITAQDFRIGCQENSISAFLSPDWIAEARIMDTGDFYYITFTGNEAYIEALCTDLFETLGIVDLNEIADSHNDTANTAYLTISKLTGLPTAAGMLFSRTHMISGYAYLMTYQTDAAIFLSSNTSYKAITGQMPPETAPETPATPLFYKVTGANGQTMWLLGTIHVGDSRTAYLPDEIIDAFHSSDALALEFDMNAFERQLQTDPDLQAQIANAYYYADGTTIEAHISDGLYEKAHPLMLCSGSNNMSMPYMKASLWENTISNFYLQQGYTLSADKGVDQRLLDRAEAEGKPVRSIESGLSQIRMTTGYSDALQALLLQEIVDVSVAEYAAETDELYELWCQGDEAALTQLLEDDADLPADADAALYEEYNKAMSTDRNAFMLDVAKQYLESGDTVFYAVGLAHLLAEDGLVNTLRAAGYTVEPIPCN